MHLRFTSDSFIKLLQLIASTSNILVFRNGNTISAEIK